MARIPEFPNFKNIELSDSISIKNFTSKFLSYSDFNFANIWSWDIHQKMMLSQLNNNLIILFNDYVLGQPFLSFIGDKNITETTRSLLEYSKKNLKTQSLKLIPEEMARYLSGSGFEVLSDRDSYDYVYSINSLANMNNWPRCSLSKGIKKFVKLYPNYVIKHSRVKGISKDEYLAMFRRWTDNKEGNSFESNEFKAFKRFFEIDNDNVEVVSLYLDDVLVGFNIFEIMSDDYAISHFSKADIKYHSSVYSVLNLEEAKILKAKGIKYYNWEQDLGILGLRNSKHKYKPALFLKKFIIK